MRWLRRSSRNRCADSLSRYGRCDLWHFGRDGCRRRGLGARPFQPSDLPFEQAKPLQQIVNALPCADGTRDEPNSQCDGRRDEQQDENDVAFHMLILALT